MGLLELFGKKPVSTGSPYSIKYSLHPIRLPSHKNDYAELLLDITNDFDKELLTSIVVVVPKQISLDQTGLSQEREVRLGVLQPGETKNNRVLVYATQRTELGIYSIKVFGIAHYRDYGHVINEVRRVIDLRVV